MVGVDGEEVGREGWGKGRDRKRRDRRGGKDEWRERERKREEIDGTKEEEEIREN